MFYVMMVSYSDSRREIAPHQGFYCSVSLSNHSARQEQIAVVTNVCVELGYIFGFWGLIHCDSVDPSHLIRPSFCELIRLSRYSFVGNWN